MYVGHMQRLDRGKLTEFSDSRAGPGLHSGMRRKNALDRFRFTEERTSAARPASIF
jgi:hypothetical protein